ncbi:sodium:proton antiporter [Corynebacterium yudongzhengii]|uniref:Sodium:proton antiporter n=1 Tax=Corynebacterium yudongzhengii TaxID=2080740 RepID=A0A2U1T6C1_9CORY|nr:Na+/H+ antiporter subunit E [Corynebacterium yudongzhengii]AWB81651.1 sodium:proton antiporter [Corynebacterium yudongzhengii]PWC01546.1 sodium:proton antiporter [Corynebacterium yudongzhengii]
MKNILTYPFRFIAFWLWYFKEFWVSNFDIVRDVVTPGNDAHPGIGRYECHSLSDWEYVLLASLITITPGTLVVGAGRDTDSGVRVLYVHGLYAQTEPELLDEIRDMEDRMINGVSLFPRYNEGAR